MDDERRLFVLFLQPNSVILRDDRVAVTVTGGGGACSVWGELEVADEGFELFTGFGAWELDADDTALEELGYLGAFELRRLRDDGESVVAGGLDRLQGRGGRWVGRMIWVWALDSPVKRKTATENTPRYACSAGYSG